MATTTVTLSWTIDTTKLLTLAVYATRRVNTLLNRNDPDPTDDAQGKTDFQNNMKRYIGPLIVQLAKEQKAYEDGMAASEAVELAFETITLNGA